MILDDGAHRYCDDCMPEICSEQAGAFAVAGPPTLAKRRAAGTDPPHGGNAGKSRGRRNANHHHAITAWKRGNADVQDSEAFTHDILPKLQDIPLSKMAKATGLTEGYCSFVRRGLKVPHRRHWEPLTALAETVDNK